eukprot:scaffold25212_cov34-Phaeocystis_antarctica.AAC.1
MSGHESPLGLDGVPADLAAKMRRGPHLQQNPRIGRPALHQGDHTQLEVFPSEIRCRGVAPSPVASQCALAGHAVHTHAKRSAVWPDLADLLPVLRRSQCRSMPPDGDAFISIYSSPRFRTLTH